MRTTITLEPDVAARLERLRKERPLKEVVNTALRAGLDALEQEVEAPAYRLEPWKGLPRRVDLDDVAELLAESEGDAWR